MDLRTQVQSAVGSAYILERELGGGGMSRVFVAEEVALGRKVVIKVLPPELVVGVNVERFNREILLAARLQQAHIVPVLSAGEIAGAPYYTMPYVEGESLRARVAQVGPLSIPEAVSVLRDVAKALAYAHDHGVVHRDIKPDNVLLAGGSAVVTDFGIAKALSASRTDGQMATLTHVGTSLGTPAYMAPEQVAGDPATDHRADIYAFGCMAYELLAGARPFTAGTPQKVLAMQLSERPRPIGEIRPETPWPLAELVMACLEKEADNRPQTAAYLLDVVESVTSPSANQTMPAILFGAPGMLWKALAFYAVAFVGVAIVAKAAIVAIGLPDWVFPGALIVMALGLPVILFTAYSHRAARRMLTATPTFTPGGSRIAQGTMATMAIKASPHLSWRRAAYGGLAAVGTFAAIVIGYMVLRALGIGPAGSLFAAGALEQHERLLIDDFASPAADTLLGAVVTEAFRTSLSQSPNITLMQPADVRDVLRRMQRPATSRVDLPLAREVAAREGLKAVIDGGILALGGKYQLSVRLVNTQTGEALASFTRTAGAQSDILPAIDRLSKELRAKIGESLKSVQVAKPLEQVTTSSLEALRKYVQAVHTLEVDGDFAKGADLLEQATTLDTGFAMAYRKYAMELSNRPGQGGKVAALLQKAYDHRDRLSDPERYLTIAAYYDRGLHADLAKANEAYEAVLDIQPDNGTALNNLGLNYLIQGDLTRAESVLRHAIALPSAASQEFTNLVDVEVALGKAREADQVLTAAQKRFPANPSVAFERAEFIGMGGAYDSAAVALRRIIEEHPSDVATRAGALFGLASLARLRGRLAEATNWASQGWAAQRSRGVAGAALRATLDSVEDEIWFRADTARALRQLELALTAHPIDSLPLIERPYPRLVALFALVGKTDRAEAMSAAFERSRRTVSGFNDRNARERMHGEIALAEKHYDAAIAGFRRLSESAPCKACQLPYLARAYDLSGNADSAAAVFSRYITTPWVTRSFGGPGGSPDPLFLAGAYKRLGELYEAKGDRVQAEDYYSRFVTLWKDADPDLQSTVKDVEKRLARLRANGPS